MRVFEGRAYREIAACLRISPELARKRVQLARDNIRRLLDHTDGGS
jgi:DNA-directed RNA polymerase specialized sigma24 family protein